MFSISEFKENIRVVRPNLFYAELTLPTIVTNAVRSKYGSIQNTEKFKFRCEATEMPGRTLATIDDQAYGPTRKIAYEVVYNDINLQIIASEDMAERKIFETWMDTIVTPTDLNYSNHKGGLLRYYDDYSSSTIKIHQLMDDGRKVCTYTLYNAYPIQLSSMNLTWEETNTYQRYSATMTYRHHTVEFYTQ